MPEPSAFEIEVATEEQSPGTDQIPAELIKAGGKAIRSEFQKLITSIWNKEELPDEWKQSIIVHSCQQKSIGLKFSKSQTGSDVRYSCLHNSSRFAFPIFAHSCRSSVLHSLQSITPRIY